MLQNLINILMFLTVLLMSTSSLHLNQNRIVPVELSTINSYRRQAIQPPSTLLNEHHPYHNDHFRETRKSIRVDPSRSQQQQQQLLQQQQLQQHHLTRSMEIDDDDDIDLMNSEFMQSKMLQPQQFQQNNQPSLQQQQQHAHSRIYLSQPIDLMLSSSASSSNNRNNNELPTSSIYNSHNQFNRARYIGTNVASPSSALGPSYDYRNNLLNYHHRQPSSQQIYHRTEQSPYKQQQHILAIPSHHLVHHSSLPMNIRSNFDEGGGDDSMESESPERNRNTADAALSSPNGRFVSSGGNAQNNDRAIHYGNIAESRTSSRDRSAFTPDDIDNLMMLNDDIYHGYEPYAKQNPNTEAFRNKNENGGGGSNQRIYAESRSNSKSTENGAMNYNEINNSNRNSLSNSNIKINNQLQPPKALQELFQQQVPDQPSEQKNTNVLKSKLASLGPTSVSSSDEYDARNDDSMMNGEIGIIPLSSASAAASASSRSFSSLDNRIKQKEQKIRAELLKRKEQLKKVTATNKSEKQKQKEQLKLQQQQQMQKDQQVNINDDLLFDSDAIFQQQQQKDTELNSSKNQNNNKSKNNNKNNNNNKKQQKRQQKKDLQANKRNGVGGNGGSTVSGNMGKPPVSHSIANQLMLRNTRGQRPYDVPQIECPSAMDGMERFACPSPDRQGRYRCIDDHVLCDGFIDCPEGEDEDRSSCMFYKTTKAHLDVLADALLRWARGR